MADSIPHYLLQVFLQTENFFTLAFLFASLFSRDWLNGTLLSCIMTPLLHLSCGTRLIVICKMRAEGISIGFHSALHSLPLFEHIIRQIILLCETQDDS